MAAIMRTLHRLMKVDTGDQIQDVRGETLLWLLGLLMSVNIIYGMLVIPVAPDVLMGFVMVAAAELVYLSMFLIARRGHTEVAAFGTAIAISSLVIGAMFTFGAQSIYLMVLFAPMTIVGFCARARYAWILLALLGVGLLVTYMFSPLAVDHDVGMSHFIVMVIALGIVPTASTFHDRFQEVLVHSLIDSNQTLEQAREQAEQANKAKSLFLAAMSHELRTPMTTIMGYTELVRESAEFDELDSEQVCKDLSLVMHAGDHLLGLIDDVLDLSRVEAGQMQLDCEPIEVAALIETLAREITHAMARNHNTLHIEHDPDAGHLTSDRKRVRQILLNLLFNAAKFTHDGDVTLRVVRQQDDSLRFDVQDTGIGLASEDQARIFERFEQADTSTTREYGGTGLGLHLSAELARALHGEITLESELGKGSCFSLILPSQPPVSALRTPKKMLGGTTLPASKASERIAS